MEAVDKLIEALAIHISEVISSGKEREHEVAEKTSFKGNHREFFDTDENGIL